MSSNLSMRCGIESKVTRHQAAASAISFAAQCNTWISAQIGQGLNM